jgi:hypothetical protein
MPVSLKMSASTSASAVSSPSIGLFHVWKPETGTERRRICSKARRLFNCLLGTVGWRSNSQLVCGYDMAIQTYQTCEWPLYIEAPGCTALCARPCVGRWCLEHAQRMTEIDDLEKEIDRIVRGRTKK